MGYERSGVSLTAWILAAAAVGAAAVGLGNALHRPFARWFIRAACSVGVNASEVGVVVVGVSGVVGAVCCLMSYTASVAIQVGFIDTQFTHMASIIST